MLQTSTEAKTFKTNGAKDPKGEFANELLDCIKKSAEPQRWLITPEMAQVMLRWNDRNRLLSKPKATHYAQIISEGRWVFNTIPIVFSSERLIDGQHRLRGCIEAGVPIEALVTFGAPDDAFTTIDTGKSRTAGDIFGIYGVSNCNNIAAATRWVYFYDQGSVMFTAGGPREMIDHPSLYAFYQQNKSIQKSMPIGHAFRKSRLAMPSLMMGVHYVCARKSRKQADEFFTKVADGIGFAGTSDPAYRLRKRLLDNAISQEKMNRRQVAALAIKAWNAFRSDRDTGALTYRAGEKFPRAI